MAGAEPRIHMESILTHVRSRATDLTRYAIHRLEGHLMRHRIEALEVLGPNENSLELRFLQTLLSLPKIRPNQADLVVTRTSLINRARRWIDHPGSHSMILYSMSPDVVEWYCHAYSMLIQMKRLVEEKPMDAELSLFGHKVQLKGSLLQLEPFRLNVVRLADYKLLAVIAEMTWFRAASLLYARVCDYYKQYGTYSLYQRLVEVYSAYDTDCKFEGELFYKIRDEMSAAMAIATQGWLGPMWYSQSYEEPHPGLHQTALYRISSREPLCSKEAQVYRDAVMLVETYGPHIRPECDLPCHPWSCAEVDEVLGLKNPSPPPLSQSDWDESDLPPGYDEC
ncbi:PolA [San Jacinto virus]|uniref:PolA n=1 Tax=San Jacinto virus TaxID=2596788 RepID=A0A516EL21_9MONO|nr:PolA [San Jacinto virus]QDO67016.1 PolA [San Jacinto virus]QFQ60719.1 polymerase A [San Jacinto virus]